MIAILNGILLDKTVPMLIIDVNGVGYEVEVSLTTFSAMPECGQQVKVFVHMIVREDAQLLYGFSEMAEKTMFQTLIKITGIGAKVALAILSSINPQRLARAVYDNDAAILVRIPGIGKKTADRMLIELQDKISDFALMPSATDSTNHIEREAISALESLGYRHIDASKKVKAVMADNLSVADIIRKALKQ